MLGSLDVTKGGAERGGKMENGGGTHYSHPATLTVEVSAVQQESPTGDHLSQGSQVLSRGTSKKKVLLYS